MKARAHAMNESLAELVSYFHSKARMPDKELIRLNHRRGLEHGGLR